MSSLFRKTTCLSQIFETIRLFQNRKNVYLAFTFTELSRAY